jgi:lipoprotein-anchoring transpeptidase ErfK/SrfK
LFSAGKASSALASSAPRSLSDRLPVELAHPLAHGTSAVAWSRSRPVAVYRSLRARSPERRFPIRNQFGITQVFLVKHAVPGWLEVYLPVRPNDSTGWIRSSSVDLTLNRYRVLVNVAAHELTTLHAGRVIMHATVGVGKPATPTPHGLFYVIEKLKMVPDTGPYGTYAFGLSAYSDVLKTFGTGDAQIALHGTDEPGSIGQNWSNGCVHLPDSVADWLAKRLPLGTPVVIS